MSDSLQSIHSAARFIPRVFGPFFDVTKIFANGARLDYRLRTAPDRPSPTEDEQKLLTVYRKLLSIIPDLEAQVKYTFEYRQSGLMNLATYIEKISNKGRSDDCSSLRNNALDYIPRIKDVQTIERAAKKEQHGFCHFMTACMLCPRHLRDDFDADMEGFCRKVQNGKLVITHNDWPSFLYPEDEYNADALDEHLLRGGFLLSCLRHLFTGPRTGSKSTPGKAAGKKCLADIYKMTKVFPETIAYVAVLCRHVLNGKEVWGVQDGSFHADAFFRNIMDLFDDQEWAEEMLDWWNRQVFGDDLGAQENIIPQPRNSGVSLLAEQRAARRALAATHPDSD